MRKLLLLFNVICFLCVSCNKENHDLEEQDESGIVQINVYYTTDENPNDELPDSNSKLFVYYGYNNYFFDFEGFSFNEGILTKKEETIFPDETMLIEDGKLTLYLERLDEPFTIIIESNHYKRITAQSYSSGKKKINFTITFK